MDIRGKVREHTRWLVLITVAASAVTVSLDGAQRGAAAQVKSRGPGWQPRSDAVEGSGSRMLTPAERATVEARFNEYERLFAAAESVARPQGFIVLPILKGSLRGGRSATIPQFSYGMLIAPRVQERTAALRIMENPDAFNVWLLDSGPPDFSDAAGAIYRERPRSGPLPGMPPTTHVFEGLRFDKQTAARNNSVMVLLTSDGVLPWADVPRERVMNILVRDAAANLKVLQDTAAQLSYEKWLSEAPARQREREQMVAGIAGVTGKAEAAKVKEDLERAERETGETMRKNDAFQQAQAKKGISLATARLTELRAELGGMSPAERAMPAWIQLTREGTYKFAPPGAPGFNRLIADRPDFYRFKGSRVQVRALLVYFHIQEYRNEEALDRAVIDSYRAFDWAAAQRMLSPPDR
jgi:hypothetical protein